MNLSFRAVPMVLQSRSTSAAFSLSHMRRCAVGILALGALFTGSLHPASAAAHGYTGGDTGTTTAPVKGLFSTGFSPSIASGTTPTSTTADTLSFGGTSYTATDDLTSTLNINALSFSNTGAVTLAPGTGANNSISLGGSNSQITLSNTGTLAINLNLALAASTSIGGNGTSATTISGSISGAFNLTKVGANTLLLSGANTYSGVTTINSGSLIAGVASVSGISGAFGNNSAVIFNSTSNVGVSLTNVVGNTTTNYSTQLGSLAGGSTLSSITLGTATLTTGGNNTSTAYAGAISGKGIVAKIGTGTQTLTSTSTYSGGTTISGGTLSGTTNSFGTGTIADNATLDLGGGTGTLNNAVSGSGALSVGGNMASPTTAGAIITMTGTNTYAGGTTVSSGTLSGNTGSYGARAVTVAQNATVDYTQSAAGTAANNISGLGSVTFGGNATSTNGKGGTITYTGQDSAAQTNVQSGTLILNNSAGPSLSGPVAVATGGAVTLATGSQIATTSPGTADKAAVTLNGGTLNVNGNDGAVSTPTSLATAKVTSSMGTLTLGASGTKTAPSLLAFGAGGTTTNPLVLAFADSSATLGGGFLNITGYTGTTNALYIGTSNNAGGSGLTQTQLSQISFNGAYGAMQLKNGEIVAAPEPSGPLSLLIGIGALGGLVWSRRRKEAKQTA